MIRLALILALALGSACSEKPSPQAREILTPALVDSVTKPMLLADIASKNASFTLSQQARNGPVQTWLSLDGVSLSFSSGVLVATRGLGEDVMSSDVRNTVQMISGQFGDRFYPRFQTYLDGENQTQFRSFQCKRVETSQEIIPSFGKNRTTTRIEEACFSQGLEVTNIYWRGSDGFLWKSQQWVSPSINYLVIEQLVR